MRKYSFILSAVAVTGLTVAAKAAPESTYWFDIRDNTGAGQIITAPSAPFTVGQGDFPNDGGAGGGRGNGQVLRIAPRTPTNDHLQGAYPNYDADANSSTGRLWLYCDVLANQDTPAGTNDVISSIGLDMAISTTAASPRFEIETVNWQWTLADPSVPVNFGTANGISSRTGVVGAKYVKVPVDGGSMYASAGGLTVGGPYRLGSLSIGAASRNFVSCASTLPLSTHSTNSTYTVNLSVNNLLITRTFSTGGNATPEERVSFGYTGGAIEADVSGNTVGGSGVRDAIIQVRMKHDGNGDGIVNALDIGGANGFNAAAAAGAGINQRQRYLFDRDNILNVNALDIGGVGGFNNWAAAGCN